MWMEIAGPLREATLPRMSERVDVFKVEIPIIAIALIFN
jgi:hypothetical protein